MAKKRPPLDIEVFAKLFSSVAEEMGIVLRRSGFSPNIKERRDFSCAVFDEAGELIAQAAHIPVHLGALPEAVNHVLDMGPLEAGDVVILNDPYSGGTHLPDITLIMPVVLGGRPLFYVVNRAHHADIGGRVPGSMALMDDLRDEGVVISPTLLYQKGRLDEEFLEGFLGRVRVPEERMGDLNGQLAALRRGEARLARLFDAHGEEKLTEMARALKDYSEEGMLSVIRGLDPGEYWFSDFLDDDGFGRKEIEIAVSLTLGENGARADFSGSSDQVRGGVNTVRAVTLAATYYVFLSLGGADYPINQGSFRPIEVITREGSVLEARYPAPVAAGNVETSQRIVDVLLGALAKVGGRVAPAASCGSMNNLAFGGVDPSTGREYTYYETVAGGMGGGPGFAGLSGLHTHMTNTLNTPIEALENSFPVTVTRYGFRRGSRGRGRFPGGMGLVRDFRFHAPAEVSILSERRLRKPYGLEGGGPGGRGRNMLISEGRERELPGKVNLTVKPGDIISIRTPGGGGYGEPDRSKYMKPNYKIENIFKIFEVGIKLAERLTSISVKSEGTTRSKYKIFMLFYFSKAYQTYKAIKILWDNNFPEDCCILTRSIFEILLQASFLSEKPEEHVARLDYYSDYEDYRFYQDLKKLREELDEESDLYNFLDGMIEAHFKDIFKDISRIEQNYQKYVQKYGSKSYNWWGKTLKQLARGFGDFAFYQYITLYRHLSKYVHPNLFTAPRYLNMHPNKHKEHSPDDTWIPIFATIYLIKIVEVTAKAHEIDLKKHIDGAHKKLEKIQKKLPH